MARASQGENEATGTRVAAHMHLDEGGGRWTKQFRCAFVCTLDTPIRGLTLERDTKWLWVYGFVGQFLNFRSPLRDSFIVQLL